MLSSYGKIIPPAKNNRIKMMFKTLDTTLKFDII